MKPSLANLQLASRRCLLCLNSSDSTLRVVRIASTTHASMRTLASVPHAVLTSADAPLHPRSAA